MGNPFADGSPAFAGEASIHTFYSEASWIEGAAIDQLRQVSQRVGVRRIAAFPDLHPGKYGPVGSAILATRLYPHLIGNDIGCGMSLFVLDIPARKLRLDKVAERLKALEGGFEGDAAARLTAAGLAPDLYPEALGTIGGGNHFCEVQGVESVADTQAFAALGLSRESTLLLVHSGSRALGSAVFDTIRDATDGLDGTHERATRYLRAHDAAVAWARLNRAVIAERAADALRTGCRLIADVPHNLIELHEGAFLHRKGAAKADIPVVPIAGSRDSASFLVRPTAAREDALFSLAHGAGRKYDRRSMTGRVGQTRSEREKLARNGSGGLVICDDRALLIEEAPAAYKNPLQVIRDLEQSGLVTTLATLKPLVTFKKSSPPDKRAEGTKRGHEKRRSRR
ncbi:release factor H-coupled RctB family protein [Breoghania corrubedonensis]|uniref:3'-phosphate/5'-hydroxy nucleic acid ligase n=1 Tax=Breoghania corrubedonensis TaxID=665038 RepID=A0A2T5VDD8_9HYPH|nr:RNA ligase RtcB family protein [Breoghania corrubedonensis]PTW61746.1 release factor H-coupled RctB family protein [Breoghania corrubedonensis]